MRVEVVKAFGIYSVGAVIPEMYPGQARTLIGRGMVREAVAEVVDKSIDHAPADRMMRPAKPGRHVTKA